MSRKLDKLKQRELNLSLEEHKNSAEPLVKGCKCYTCCHYTRAYIYHMLEVKEMNANILLGIHNMAMFDRLFAMTRAHLGPGFARFVEAYLETNCV